MCSTSLLNVLCVIYFIRWMDSWSVVLFFFFPRSFLLSSSKRKNFLSFSSLSLFSHLKKLQKKKKVRLKSIRRRRKNRRRREILVAFTVESFYLLAFRILSLSSCCCMGFFCRRVLISVAFSRARHIIWKDFCERKKGACDFFY